ncbi:MAG: transcription termination/antitermination protein NusA, partial [Chloroflexi bacterium]|nr:transcription termination/antitermination protein NusA [Chloroflexota bacterium]
MKSELVTAIGQLASEKGVSKEAILEAIEAALVSAYKRNENSLAERLTAKIDPGTQEFRIYHDRTVVEGEPETPDEISLAEARGTDPKVGVGGTVSFDVTTRHFGRIAAQTAKQVVLLRLREAERESVFEDFTGKEGELVS